MSRLRDWVLGKAPLAARRSPGWRKVRADHLKRQPLCAVCGTSSGLEVHHIRPFHLYPERELDPTNLITLCEKTGGGCHLRFGHLWCFRSFNPTVAEDALDWQVKIRCRPR